MCAWVQRFLPVLPYPARGSHGGNTIRPGHPPDLRTGQRTGCIKRLINTVITMLLLMHTLLLLMRALLLLMCALLLLI